MRVQFCYNSQCSVYLLLILTDSVLDFICVLLLVFFFRRFDFVSFFPSQGPHNAVRIFSKVKIRKIQKEKEKRKKCMGFHIPKMYLANFKTFFIFLSIVAKRRRLFSKKIAHFLKRFFSALCDYVTFLLDLSSFFFRTQL